MGDTVIGKEVKGIDNPAATEDDGTRVKPDLVISIQPSHGNIRAQLPVSTLDWRSNNQGQFIPIHGLDFLIGVSSLLIQQTVELNDLTSKIESENRYIVRVPNGEALYIARETSSSTQRCLCGAGRAFTMHLHDNTRQEAMVMSRRLAAASCCFPCRLQEMKVVTPPGDYVGRVQQQCTWIVPFFLVRDANEQVLFVIEGPAALKRSALLLSEFKIMTGDSLREVGRIAHGWDRDLNSFTTTLQAPTTAVQPKHKALLLAAAFLLSLEWYKGDMVHDTMHGYGDYRWRYEGPTHTGVSYEGKFYNNHMHGYGTMSYPDGRVFSGLYYNNIRWGAGVESHACLREDVGLWYGYQLIRLAWRPPSPSVAIDLASTPIGCNVVAPHRVLLTTNTKIIGEVNSALELLKQYGAEPLTAAEKWTKLYPKHCTDTDSQLCHIEVFDRAYYNDKIHTLREITALPEQPESQGSLDSMSDKKTYYAWNNDQMIIHMMKHSFTHEEQRKGAGVNLAAILAGPRSSFKTAGKHELDCRTLMMAAYLGHTSNVAQLINECDVIPDVTDMQGNSVVMYAACGDQPEVLHFLVEAGGLVDGYNDACCTPLAVTLLRYALEKRDVAYSGMLQALLPPPSAPGPPPPDVKVSEWNIQRDLTQSPSGGSGLQKSPSKTYNKPATQLQVKKIMSTKEVPNNNNNKKKPEGQKLTEGPKKTEVDPFVEETLTYNNIKNEYLTKVAEAFSFPSGVNPIPYLFDVRDMVKDIELSEEEQKKVADKNPKKTVSKVLKDAMKPSRDMMWQGMDKEDGTLDSRQQMKQEKMTRIMQTIMQLLSEGADPRKIRCPQPPLLTATMAGCADLVREMVKYGADINEVYPQALGYTTLDLAVSGPMTSDNLDVIRTLLECGAKADHRLQVPEPMVTSPDVPEPVKDDGPTLLHAVMARRLEMEPEEELRRQILELLLQYGCDPITQFKGRSAVEVAMAKDVELFDIFIKSPNTDLNAIINDSNQSILVKMFYLPYCRTLPLTEKLQTLTNLLLYGADPLLKCQNGKDEYVNLIVFARKVLSELDALRKPPSPTGNAKKAKSEIKAKKADKPKKEDKAPAKPAGPVSKSPGKTGDDQIGDYKQTLDLVVDCARLLYIRWLQAKLMKELITLINKYKHRPWNMIEKEHKNKQSTGLWLTAVRCLEIWDALKTTKKKIYNDDKILKYLLCIVHFYYKRTRKILRCPDITYQEKLLIEAEVASYIHEHKLATMSTPNMVPGIRPYVTPELTVKQIEKFNVCFECCMPLADAKIPCGSCKLISFCSFACMKQNIARINCHPCSSYLKDKYFPTPEETETADADQDL